MHVQNDFSKNATSIPSANAKSYPNGFKMLLFLSTGGQKAYGKIGNNYQEKNYLSEKLFSCSFRKNEIR
jgi:hypothetical protein